MFKYLEDLKHPSGERTTPVRTCNDLYDCEDSQHDGEIANI